MTSWGQQVGNWRCGVDASVAVVDAKTARVTVKSVWQSLGYGFDVRYCSASTSCDGVSGGTVSGIRVYSGYGSTVEVTGATHTYDLPRLSAARSVKVQASFTLPDFQAGSAYASTVVEVPGMEQAVPDAPTGMAAAIDGDRASLSWANNPAEGRPYGNVVLQMQVDSGAWQGVATLAGDATSYTVQVVANRRYNFRIYAINDAGGSGVASSGYVYTTPAAPTGLSAAYTGSSVALQWSSTAAWVGSYALERSADGGASWASLGAIISNPYTDTAAPQGTLVYRLRTVVPGGSATSAWVESNAVSTYTSADYPSVTVPALGTIADVPKNVTWTVAPGSAALSNVRAEVVVGGSVVQTLPASTATSGAGTITAQGLVDGQPVALRVVATGANGLVTTAQGTGTVQWAKPAAPNASVAFQPGDLSARVQVSDEGGAAKAVACDVYRIFGGEEQRVAAGVPLPARVVDPVPPVGAEFSYRVEAFAANGEGASRTLVQRFDSKAGALTFVGPEGHETVPCAFDLKLSGSASRSGTAYSFAGAKLPTWYGGPGVAASYAAECVLETPDVHRAVALAREHGTVYARDPSGGWVHGAPSWSWSHAYDTGGYSALSMSLTETEAPYDL